MNCDLNQTHKFLNNPTSPKLQTIEYNRPNINNAHRHFMGARVPILGCSHTTIYQASYAKRALTMVYRNLLRHFRSCSMRRGICHPENPTYARQQSPIRPTTDSHRVVHTIIPNHLLPRLASPKLAQSQALLYDFSTRHHCSHYRHHRPIPGQYTTHTLLIRHS